MKPESALLFALFTLFYQPALHAQQPERDTLYSPNGQYRVLRTYVERAEVSGYHIVLQQITTGDTVFVSEVFEHDWPSARVDWSANGRYFISEAMVGEPQTRVIVIYDLKQFKLIRQFPGVLLNFDPKNGVLFFYRSGKDYQSQQLWVFYLNQQKRKMIGDYPYRVDMELPDVKFDPKSRKGTVQVVGSPVEDNPVHFIPFSY